MKTIYSLREHPDDKEAVKAQESFIFTRDVVDCSRLTDQYAIKLFNSITFQILPCNF